MGRYQCEMFGQFIYGDILTYEELQDVEALFVPRLDELLQQAGAAHVDFTPTGDILLVQCVFEAQKTYIFRKLAQELAALLPEAVRGNLLFLKKDLSVQHLYWLEAGSWREEERTLPESAPEHLPVRQVTSTPLWPVPEPEEEEEDGETGVDGEKSAPEAQPDEAATTPDTTPSC